MGCLTETIPCGCRIAGLCSNIPSGSIALTGGYCDSPYEGGRGPSGMSALLPDGELVRGPGMGGPLAGGGRPWVMGGSEWKAMTGGGPVESGRECGGPIESGREGRINSGRYGPIGSGRGRPINSRGGAIDSRGGPIESGRGGYVGPRLDGREPGLGGSPLRPIGGGGAKSLL